MGLLRDPGVEGCLNIRVEPQPNLRPNPCPRPATLVFLTLGYCNRPRLVVPRTLLEPEQGWHLAPALTPSRLSRKEAKDGCWAV